MTHPLADLVDRTGMLEHGPGVDHLGLAIEVRILAVLGDGHPPQWVRITPLAGYGETEVLLRHIRLYPHKEEPKE